MTDQSFGAALSRLWPHAPHATIEAVTAVAETVFNKYGIETPLERAHFMAQISHECGAGTIVRENMSYCAPRIIEVFGYDKVKKRWNHSARVTDGEAEQLAHNPEHLAERVYGLGNPKKAKELGNVSEGDAYRYRGAGMLQLTGLGSFIRIGQKTGFDLAGDPDQLAHPEISFRVAAAEFVSLKCLEASQADNVEEVTRRVNGGRNGLAERTVWLRKWKNALDGVDEPAQRPRGAPDPAPKSIVQSKIAQGSVIGGAAATITAAKEIANTASEVTSAARDTADNAGAVVSVTQPLLSSATLPWALLAIAVVAAIGFVLWKRYRKLQDEGV